MTLNEALDRIGLDLRELRAAHALVGGLAVSARAEPRFTRDADLAVAVADDAEAEALIHALQTRGYALVAVVEQKATGRLATARLTRGDPAHAPLVGLLFASSGIEPEVVALAEPLEVTSAMVLPVARSGHLIALKVLSRDDRLRPQDGVDLRALLRIASAEDLALARRSLEAITERGFDRGRDLIPAFESILT